MFCLKIEFFTKSLLVSQCSYWNKLHCDPNFQNKHNFDLFVTSRGKNKLFQNRSITLLIAHFGIQRKYVNAQVKGILF